MAKLFAFEDHTPAPVKSVAPEVITPMDEQLYAIQMAHESMVMANTQLDIVCSIKTHLSDSTGSMQVGMEHFAPIIESIASNFGVRSNLPALEAYSDKYASKAAKEIALESIGGFFKAIWDRLVGFVKALFNAFKGLIMGFKGTEAGKVLAMEEIQKKIETLISSEAKLANTDKITTKLPSLLSDVGVTDFSSSDLLLQSSVRISSFVTVIDTVNKSDSEVNTELKTSLSNINNSLADDLKKVTDLKGKIKAMVKKQTLPIEQMMEVGTFITNYSDHICTVESVDVRYFPDTMLQVVSEKELPPAIYDKIKSTANYVSCIAKKVATQSNLSNLSYYVVLITCGETNVSTSTRLYSYAPVNVKTSSSLDPISSLDELRRLTAEVVALSRKSLTIDVKRITDTFSSLLDNIRDNSLKMESTITEVTQVIVAVKKDVEAASGQALSGIDNEAETREQFSRAMSNFKTRILKNTGVDTKVRSAILDASRELTAINSEIVKIKGLVLNAYLDYFTKNIEKFE